MLRATQKEIREMAEKLAQQGLCNEKAMGYKEWFEKRDGQDYTRIAYARNNYGIVSEIYYLKGTKEFAYV